MYLYAQSLLPQLLRAPPAAAAAVAPAVRLVVGAPALKGQRRPLLFTSFFCRCSSSRPRRLFRIASPPPRFRRPLSSSASNNTVKMSEIVHETIKGKPQTLRGGVAVSHGSGDVFFFFFSFFPLLFRFFFPLPLDNISRESPTKLLPSQAGVTLWSFFVSFLTLP